MSKIKFQPHGVWIIVPNPQVKERESGIILSDADAKKLQTNVLEVLAVGPDCRHTKVGDTVMIDPTSQAMTITINEGKYLAITEMQILGKML